MTKYKVVRSYGPGSQGREEDLTKAFNEGWEFVRASDYVVSTHSGKSGYIEYILKKEVDE